MGLSGVNETLACVPQQHILLNLESLCYVNSKVINRTIIINGYCIGA